jgi:hypothetical protein
MATVIKIKSASNANEPAADVLAQAEQAYSYQSNKLFIGKTESDGSGGTQVNPIVIGGQHFTDMLDHTAGTTTASSALIVDADNRINILSIGSAGTHLDFANATITADGSGTDVSLTLNAKGSGSIDVSSKRITSVGTPTANTDAATKAYVDTATGSLSASLTVGADSGTDDVITVGTDTLTFDGGTGIDTTVSDNQVSFAIDSSVVTTSDTALTIGSTAVTVGGTITDLAGLTSVVVDDLTIDGSTISTTASDNNILLSPHGEGTVTLPSGYESRTGLGANSIVPKSYVDAIAEGLHVHASAKAATTQTLAAQSGGTVTYINGAAGVGATLGLSTAITTLDGYTLVDGDRILIKDETAQEHNGIYIRTDSTTFTRATDFDTVGEIASGDFLFVENGTINGSNGYVQTETHTAIGGANDDIIFEQFSGAGQIEAGSALSKSGNTLNVAVDGSSIEIASDALQVKASGITNTMLAGSIDLTTKVTGTLPVTNGGTGLATVTSNGVVLGNGTSALAVTAASTADGSILQAGSAGTPAFSNIIDGGSFDV